jgi:hypothetical protein
MATAQTNGHDKTYDFTPTEYDVTTVPPRIGAGRYEFALTASIRGTKKDNLPMLVVEGTAETVLDGNEDNEQFIGSTISDFIVLSNDTKFRGHKLRLRDVLEAIGLSMDVVPRSIQNKGDAQELIDAITGQKAAVTVVHKTNEQTGETRENMEWRKPPEEASSDDTAAEAAPPARGAKKSAAKGSKAARR